MNHSKKILLLLVDAYSNFFSQLEYTINAKKLCLNFFIICLQYFYRLIYMQVHTRLMVTRKLELTTEYSTALNP